MGCFEMPLPQLDDSVVPATYVTWVHEEGALDNVAKP